MCSLVIKCVFDDSDPVTRCLSNIYDLRDKYNSNLWNTEFISVDDALQYKSGSEIATCGDTCWAFSEKLPELLQPEI
jgi:hypothetical protein